MEDKNMENNSQMNNSQAGVCEPIRVLHVFGRVGLGGAESRIMDLYRNIDRDKIQFDFLVHYSAKKTGKMAPTSDELLAVREPDYYDEAIRELGGNIYVLPRFEGKNFFAYKKAISNFFSENRGKWQVVHGHMTSTAALYLPVARKKGGAAVTIAHSRNAGTEPGLKGIATKILRIPLKRLGTADHYFTCSEKAGRAVFGDKLFDQGFVRTIPNAIDVKKFAYDADIRNKIRAELGVSEDEIVIGHVGRFDYQKNHEYLIRIFDQVLKLAKEKMPDRKLLLIMLGQGSLMDTVKAQVNELGIQDRVRFLGLKGNSSDYYRAMDYFLFPSFFEGLPGTVVEAQAAGLKCLISDTITTEVDITELVSRMDIRRDPSEWAEKILEDLGHLPDRQAETPRFEQELADAGFDAQTQARAISYFYEHGSFKD